MCVKGCDASARSSSFSWPACGVLCKGGESVLVMRETLWKNVNFIKDAPMIRINFSTSLVSEKKKVGSSSIVLHLVVFIHVIYVLVPLLHLGIVLLRHFPVQMFYASYDFL